VQSNWIRDKGFGMGKYVPRIVSPITGEEEAAPSDTRYTFPLDEPNMARWQVWWRRANLEQFLSFAVIAAIAIIVFSLVAYATVYGHPDLPDESGFDFIQLESQVLDDVVGSWFGTLFLAVGAISLFAAALGIIDYVARLVADVVRTGYLPRSERWTESKLYFLVVWSLIAFGTLILLAGFDQPLVLVTISTVLGGFIMFVYSGLLIVTNRRHLPEPVRVRGVRLAALVWAVALLGTTSAIVGVDQIGNLL
jgi:amino acid transporter